MPAEYQLVEHEYDVIVVGAGGQDSEPPLEWQLKACQPLV